MPVNAAGKSAEAAADERAGRPASAGERTKASTKDRTPGSAAQEALLGLVPGWDYQDMPPSYLLAGTMNSYQSTSKTSRFA